MLPAEVQRELLYRASTGAAAHNSTSFYRDPATTSPDRSLQAFSFFPGDIRFTVFLKQKKVFVENSVISWCY